MTSHLQQVNAALVVGASGGIGLEMVHQLLKQPTIQHVYATYNRSQDALHAISDPRLTQLPLDLTNEAQLATVVHTIQATTPALQLVVNCAGVLHTDTMQPEKSLRHLNPQQLSDYFLVNSIGPALLAKHLPPLFKQSDRAVFATLSAKLGSIGDNQLGGWYGYRASKAALNQLMRTTAIEYKRTCPNAIVVTLHPGTTDTHLSRPFQRNVPPEKLFTTQRTVQQLLLVIDQLQAGDSGEFFSWDGNRLPW